MVRSVFIPSRNSRHRTAVLALYRALLKTGKNVPLPESLSHAGGHPVTRLVKKRFAKNTHYTSLRLVYASIAAGYKFLTLLKNGQTPTSPEHTEIVNHLRNRFKTSVSTHAKRPPHEFEPKHAPPLLTRISSSSKPPGYASTVRPRPKPAFEGIRKVPHVVATAEGQPFLRDRKPQPRILSRAIRRRDMVMVRKIAKISDLEQEIVPASEEEDNWDRLVRRQVRTEGLENRERPEGPLESYRWNAQLSRIWTERQIERIWKDWVARGKALQQIVNEETVLAKEEKGGFVENEKGEGSWLDNSQQTNRDRDRNLEIDGGIDRTRAFAAFKDPFLSDEWIALVQRAERKHIKDDRQQGTQDFTASQWQIKRQQGRIDPIEPETSSAPRVRSFDAIFKGQRRHP